jgi:fatty acid desaturase
MGWPGLWAFLREIIPARTSEYRGPLGFYIILFSVSVYFGAAWVFGLWCWSILTGFWAVFRIRTWFEHVGLETAGRHGSHRFHANGLMRFLFFPHNTHCHYEHHLYPQVPYSNLPKLRKLLRERSTGDCKPVLSLMETIGQFEELQESNPAAIT